MAEYEQLEISFEASPEKERHADKPRPVSDQARAFFESQGFDQATVDKLDHAEFRSTAARSSWSYTKAAYRKPRQIEVPNPLMRAIQTWLLNGPLSGLESDISQAACGINGRSLHDMVEPHRCNSYFFKLDLEKAYQSVDISRLARIVSTRLQSDQSQWEDIISRFASTGSGLATGGILSPLLFNLYMAPLDEELADLAETYGLTMTRYMDDIVFSSGSVIGRKKAKRIKSTISSYGLPINQNKVRYHRITPSKPFMITGLQLNHGGQVRITSRGLANIRRELRLAANDMENYGEIDLHLMGVVRGLAGFVRQFKSDRPNKAEQEIIKLYHELERAYRSPNILHILRRHEHRQIAAG